MNYSYSPTVNRQGMCRSIAFDDAFTADVRPSYVATAHNPAGFVAGEHMGLVHQKDSISARFGNDYRQSLNYSAPLTGRFRSLEISPISVVAMTKTEAQAKGTDQQVT
jgi:hypothetical protein